MNRCPPGTGDQIVMPGSAAMARTVARWRSSLADMIPMSVRSSAAFLTEPEADTLALISGKFLESVVVDERGTTVDPTAAAEVFYGDADSDTAAAMIARLRPKAIAATEPSQAEPAWAEPAWRSIPATYVACTNDQAIPVDAQGRWPCVRRKSSSGRQTTRRS
jgi:pimeloyl-ACP methyl ester carboxylesterase